MEKELNEKVKKRLLPLVDQADSQEGSRRILRNFNQKVKSIGGFKIVAERLQLLFNYFRHPETSRVKKALAGAALLYFIIPSDVLPDIIPVAGFIDDAAAVTMIWKILTKELDQFETQVLHAKENE